MRVSNLCANEPTPQSAGGQRCKMNALLRCPTKACFPRRESGGLPQSQLIATPSSRVFWSSLLQREGIQPGRDRFRAFIFPG